GGLRARRWTAPRDRQPAAIRRRAQGDHQERRLEPGASRRPRQHHRADPQRRCHKHRRGRRYEEPRAGRPDRLPDARRRSDEGAVPQYLAQAPAVRVFCMTRQYLAFDLGAESGRAIAAKLGENGALTMREVCRFANEPLREQGALRWDALRLWGDITRTLDRAGQMRFDSVGVDAWGVDYALLDERGTLLENPYHYRDLRNEGMMEEVFARIGRDRIYGITGIQFLQI